MNNNNSKFVTPKSEIRLATNKDIVPKELIIKNEIVFTWIPGTRPVIIPRLMPINVNKTENRSIEMGDILSVYYSRTVLHSHSIVPGGLFVMSYTTLLTSSFIWFVIFVEILAMISGGILLKLAVIASKDCTALIAIVCP